MLSTPAGGRPAQLGMKFCHHLRSLDRSNLNRPLKREISSCAKRELEGNVLNGHPDLKIGSF